MIIFPFFIFIFPSHLFPRKLLSRSLPVVTQIRGRIVGAPPPSPLRYVPSFLSREEFNIFFPRRLASNCTYPRCYVGALSSWSLFVFVFWHLFLQLKSSTSIITVRIELKDQRYLIPRRSIANRGKRLIMPSLSSPYILYILLQKNHRKCPIIFALSRPEHHIFYFLFLRRDPKAYANNSSYSLPLSTKNWQSYASIGIKWPLLTMNLRNIISIRG